ncbi:type II toxin-antitoxin system VapC family toxin, partial [Microcystis aeruginosa]|uniref:type II toxin-antitoxin system VapC family toxin n=1 Tax=Microcystis aeruginosa TaxID=1126 RepID=UPI001C89402D
HITVLVFVLKNVSVSQVVTTLPFHHRDPFDRLLIAQAMVEKMSIISADEIFDSYGISRIW